MQKLVLAAMATPLLFGTPALADEATKGAPLAPKFEPQNNTPKADLVAPSNLKIISLGTQTLTLSWIDNSAKEYGVDIYVLDLETARTNPKEAWKRVANAQERDMSKVEGRGLRTEGDIEYVRNVNTCFQARSYIGFSRSKVSKFSNMVCTDDFIHGGKKENPKTGPVAIPPSTKAALEKPTDLAVTSLGQDRLTLTWMDNSIREYGVDIYRMDPVTARRDKTAEWEHIADYSERMDAFIKGKGPRSDDDFDLTPDTNYCYRVRAYFGFSRSEVSDFSNVACVKTLK